jgi:ADP-ribose pyrophosphatase YjhB (NUDIX family)
MAKAQASLGVTVAVFGFDPSPDTAANRALHVLAVRQGLPKAELDARETFEAAGARAVEEAGMRLETGRKGRGGRLHLVGLDDAPGGRARVVTAWYYATVPYAEAARPAVWSLPGRGLRLDAPDSAALKAALEHLRSESRHVAGAVGLLGEVFTGDDLLRLYVALHGGPEGSERTFRRRVQELRDGGVLKPVRDSEVAALRLRVSRFRSPAGTGGRPPELLRYAGSGGEEEQLAVLRTRRPS